MHQLGRLIGRVHPLEEPSKAVWDARRRGIDEEDLSVAPVRIRFYSPKHPCAAHAICGFRITGRRPFHCRMQALSHEALELIPLVRPDVIHHHTHCVSDDPPRQHRVGRGGGHEYGIDRFTTQLAWEYHPNTQHGTEAATELYDGVVYHDGGDGYIYALRASDGSLVWRGTTDLSLGGAITNRDMLVTSRRVIFSDGMTLHVLDRQNGRVVTSTKQPQTSDSYFASPAAYANGQVFVTVGGGAWSFDEP